MKTSGPSGLSNELNRRRGAVQGNFGPAGPLAPMFRPPSHAEVVEVVVSEIVGGRAIVAVRGEAGVGKTALVQRTASRLRGDGRTVATMDGDSASPRTMLQLIAQALRIGDAEMLEPELILQRMQSWEGKERVVLLIDDAERLSSAMFQTISLLMKLFDLRPTALQVVLVGRPGQWPGVQTPELETMRRATLSLHTIAAPPLELEAGDAELGAGPGGWAGPVAADGVRRGRLSRKSNNRIVIAALGLLMTGIATAELIDLSDALGPSQEATRAVVIQPSAPRAPAVDPDDTASGALPHGPVPELAAPVPEVTPVPAPAPSETRTVEETSPVADEAQSERINPVPGGQGEASGGPGLVLVAGAGDNLPALYAKVYRGVTPPPYPQVVAANRMPMKPGVLVVFPEPPAGWPLR